MSSARKNAAKNGASSRPLLFVVDDEPMLLELASVILQPEGYLVRTFRDPETALRAFRAADPRPELVITDYSMHTMNGLDLIEACRRIVPEQKFLMVSGTVDEHVYRNSNWKPNRFLAKPYQSKELLDLVARLLEH